MVNSRSGSTRQSPVREDQQQDRCRHHMNPARRAPPRSRLWRARLVPAWSGIALILGGLTFVPGREGNIVVTVVTDLLLVGLLSVSRTLLAAARRN